MGGVCEGFFCWVEVGLFDPLGNSGCTLTGKPNVCLERLGVCSKVHGFLIPVEIIEYIESLSDNALLKAMHCKDGFKDTFKTICIASC